MILIFSNYQVDHFLCIYLADISLFALYVFNAESSFDIFSEFDFPGLKIKAILGL